MDERVYLRTLRRTAELLGGEEPLAAFLKVRQAIVHTWLEDSTPIPPEKFLQCVDYLLDVHVKWLAERH